MLTVALRTLRTRWVTFTGSFVALALGVALLTVTGLALASSLDAPDRAPRRFAAAPVVVRGQDTLRVPTPVGDRTEKLGHPRAVPAETVARLKGLGRVVEDRTFAVRAADGTVLTGHPWSTAAFTPYELTAGRAPKSRDEVVAAGTDTRPGTRLRTDRGTVHVVGTAEPRTTSQHSEPTGPSDPTLFFTDTRAARLSPSAPTQLIVTAPPAAVRAAVADAPGVQVLTGDARRLADPGPDRDAEALTAMNALFGTAGGVTAFVSVFVVASTFAFAVAQRRREFGLLRTAGATPGQIRRTVGAEALLVGVLASASGCVLGGYGAPHLAARVVAADLAPPWFVIGDHTWPYHLGFWTGLLVALLGVAAASWRAGRTGPAQALREASVDAGAMTWGRWLCGAGLLLAAAVTLVLALADDPGELLHRKTYVSRPMLLITAVALLAPVLVRPLTRLLARLPGATGMLVRENAAAGVRRTAAIAAPVLVTVGLAGSLLGAPATVNAAKAAETRARTAADFVVTPRGDTVLDPVTLRRLRAVPGADVSVTSSSAVYVLEEGVALIKSEARAAEPDALAATARLPLAAGRAADLDDGSIIVNEEWERHGVGDRVDVWLGDGTRRSLRVAAVLRTGTGDNGVYVTPANAPGARADRVDVRLRDEGAAAAVSAALRTAAGESAQVRTADAWVRATHPETNRSTRYGLFLVLGIALLYTGISLVNTMVMATSDRVRELTALRLAGATRAQTLRVVAAEALTVVALGGALGLLVAVLNLLGMRAALALLEVPAGIRIPWPVLGTVLAGCAALAVIASVVPAALALRRTPVHAAT
ncbi:MULTISPECIES: FtsX-like permease family protein [unclassified Streptomyces]|uniref:FtsX-like permease family protein n=1 Tax=unclassified Streptomyces TaxID=2593676 RepID=UPI00093EA91D|nr:FtsX-like permease family protein [Streptomyces sp. TSRI0107]OKJ71431.1 ABC transporter permease [Streptomyces sp. TSRI0107]